MKHCVVLLLGLATWLLPAAQAQEDGEEDGEEVLDWVAGFLEPGQSPEEFDWDPYMLEEGVMGSKSNPVLCHQPSGEREYLERLRCSNGVAPWYERIGSFREGPDGHIADGYFTLCDDYYTIMFMDMYHEDHWETAPVGEYRMALPD